MKSISEYRLNPLEEEAEIVPYNELHVVVLGTGDGDGTFADIVEEVSVKRDIKYNLHYKSGEKNLIISLAKSYLQPNHIFSLIVS